MNEVAAEGTYLFESSQILNQEKMFLVGRYCEMYLTSRKKEEMEVFIQIDL